MDTARSEALQGQKVVVLGLGLFGGGAGAARWALRGGADVLVTDLRGEAELGSAPEELRAWARARGVHERLRFVLSRHEAEDLRSAGLVIVNPGVPPSARILDAAREGNARLATAISILLAETPCPIAAVTGTNGKSSTVQFLSQALGHAGLDAHTGGNIGGSLLDHVEAFTGDSVVALELSSYQLEHAPADTRCALRVAAITNVGRDHIAWHGSLEAYERAKLRILELVAPGGAAIIPAGRLVEHAARARSDIEVIPFGEGQALGIEGSRVLLQGEELGNLEQLGVLGPFQRANAAVALAAARLMGAGAESTRSVVPLLKGLPHRLEPLGIFPLGDGHIELIDNAVSTTPASTVASMEALPDARGERFLIVGGAPKRDLGFEGLASAAVDAGWTLVPFGQSAADIARAGEAVGARILAVNPDQPHHLAVRAALRSALTDSRRTQPAQVLLSPACASFDGYPNFRARAEAFRKALTA